MRVGILDQSPVRSGGTPADAVHETLECVLVRSDGEAVAVNLDIEPVEPPETVRWIDPTHPHG